MRVLYVRAMQITGLRGVHLAVFSRGFALKFRLSGALIDMEIPMYGRDIGDEIWGQRTGFRALHINYSIYYVQV